MYMARTSARLIGTDNGSSSSGGCLPTGIFSGLSEERGVEEVDGGLGPWLEIVCDHISNYERDTKNNSESQVSWFYRGEKITMGAGCHIIRGSL